MAQRHYSTSCRADPSLATSSAEAAAGGTPPRGHFGHCPALPSFVLGRKPNSHAEPPLIPSLLKLWLPNWGRGIPPNILLATDYWKNYQMLRLLGTGPFGMQGLEAAVGCPGDEACTGAEAERGWGGK